MQRMRLITIFTIVLIFSSFQNSMSVTGSAKTVPTGDIQLFYRGVDSSITTILNQLKTWYAQVSAKPTFDLKCLIEEIEGYIADSSLLLAEDMVSKFALTDIYEKLYSAGDEILNAIGERTATCDFADNKGETFAQIIDKNLDDDPKYKNWCKCELATFKLLIYNAFLFYISKHGEQEYLKKVEESEKHYAERKAKAAKAATQK